PGWAVQSVMTPRPDQPHLKRSVTFAVLDDGTIRAGDDSFRLQAGNTVLVRLRSGNQGIGQVDVFPVRTQRGERVRDELAGTRRSWEVKALPARTSNESLELSVDDEVPLVPLDRQILKAFEGPWSISFWVRSTRPESALWSAWNGVEGTPYPFDFELDRDGRLVAFTGTGDRHYAMRSAASVADGAWHHVILSSGNEGRQLRLFVDGLSADSLTLPVRPQISSTLTHFGIGRRASSDFTDVHFEGGLDELMFFPFELWKESRSTLRSQSVISGPAPIWLADFDGGPGARSADRNWLSSISANIRPSLLSFRRGPSDIRVDVLDDGLELSFAQGDAEIIQYAIERSWDGVEFRPLTTIESGPENPGRLQWTDRTVPDGVVHYRVVPIYADGPGTSPPAIKAGFGTEADLSSVRLEGNFPNPFNPTTTIRFEVLEPQTVRVSVWDLSGQMVASLVDAHHTPGRYEVGFQADNLPSGTYFVRLESGTGIQTHQMILMK
ncbi:MAG: T9SS type A sorting domain-containing protein, partial [Bacteroidota bacterium]|nr:T9SS type A sorting domain-containing protein [Bacteroidota bacterium]